MRTMGKAGGRAPLAMTCSGAISMLGVVEIGEIGGGDVDGADGEADLAVVDQVEIDQLFQRLVQGRGVIEGGGGARAARGEPGIEWRWA